MTALMNATEVATRLGMSTKWVYAAAKSGELPCVRLSEKAVRFEPAAIEEWLRQKGQADG